MSNKSVYPLKASISKKDWKRLQVTNSFTLSNLKNLLSKVSDRVDLRETGLLREPFDQGPLESSVGISLVSGCLEYAFRKKYGSNSYPLSSLYVYEKDKLALFPDPRNTTTTMVDAIRILKKKGCCPESFGDYSLSTMKAYGSDEIDLLAQALKIKKAYRIDSLSQAKHCLNQGYPVAVLLKVFENMFDVFVYRTGDIPIPTSTDKQLGHHALYLVGYDNLARHFIVRNSWSKSWGDYGDGYLPFDAFKSLFIEGYSLRL